MDILSKILTHEKRVFEEYSTHRTMFIEHLSKVDTTKLTKKQLKIMTYNIKAITQPIKTSISEIQNYFTDTCFEKDDTIEHFNYINGLYFLGLLLNLGSDSPEDSSLNSDSLEDSSSESESPDDSSLDDDDSNSSKSVSVTFSNTHTCV